MESDINEYRSTFVGTSEYISPEMINHSRASKEADLWALGCIIYEVNIFYLNFIVLSWKITLFQYKWKCSI